jgi:hypothetical protein
MIPNYRADLQLDGKASFKAVNSCKTYINRAVLMQNTAAEMNWRPYESSKALSSYHCTAAFAIREANASAGVSYFPFPRLLHIDF